MRDTRVLLAPGMRDNENDNVSERSRRKKDNDDPVTSGMGSVGACTWWWCEADGSLSILAWSLRRS